MRKISDYMRHAAECRKLAQTADTPEHTAALLTMASTWLELARARQEEIERQKRLERMEAKTRGLGAQER